VRRILDEQVRGGTLHRHPKLGRRQTYGRGPADPTPHLAPLIEKAVRATARKGFAEAAVRRALVQLAGAHASPASAAEAADAADPAELIRATILALNPRAAEGALIFLPHVRIAVGGRLDKPSFDRTLLALLSQERIQLQAHPVPVQLTPEEKEAMVPDGRGSYYMAVGLR
jgi:hypothetical protein